jgi:hypothetical protein
LPDDIVLAATNYLWDSNEDFDEEEESVAVKKIKNA